MLGSAEPPRRIQIGFPSSETKKRKKKKFLYLNSYFPLQPVPTLLDSTVPYLDNVLMSCTTWSKIAQLGSYPGIIKCPWVLASTLHNWREEREVGGGGWRSKWQCTVLWLCCRVAGECHRSSQRAPLAERPRREKEAIGGRSGMCGWKAQLLFSQHMLICEMITLNKFVHHLLLTEEAF